MGESVYCQSVSHIFIYTYKYNWTTLGSEDYERLLWVMDEFSAVFFLSSSNQSLAVIRVFSAGCNTLVHTE